MLLGIIYVVPNITVAQLLGRDLLAFIRLCLKYHQMEFQYCYSTIGCIVSANCIAIKICSAAPCFSPWIKIDSMI